MTKNRQMPTTVNTREPMAFLTSADGGLAHYVTQLWQTAGHFFDLHYLTYAEKELDPFVTDHSIPNIQSIIDPQRLESIGTVIEYFRKNNIRLANLQVGTTAKLHVEYYIKLLNAFRAKGVHVILTLHDVLPFGTISVDMNRVGVLYSLADGFLVGNETERGKLYEHFRVGVGNTPVAIVPHGPYTLFDQGCFINRKAARSHLNLPQDVPILLFFGRLRPDKGLDCLLEAWPLLRERMPNALLFISTDTSYTPQLKKKIDALIAQGHKNGLYVQRGYVLWQAIEAIFKASNAAVMPYEEVSQSGILALAKALGLPVIVSELFDDANEINDFYGLSVPVRNPRALADAMFDLFSRSAAKQADMGETGKRLAKQDWAINVSRMIELIRGIPGMEDAHLDTGVSKVNPETCPPADRPAPDPIRHISPSQAVVAQAA